MANDENAVSEQQKTEQQKEQQKTESTSEESQARGQEGASDSSPEKQQDKKLDKKERKALDRLQQELDETKTKADENWNEYLRACAELENTKRRMQRDIENAHKYAVEKFVIELLPVKDSLEMGLEAAKDQNGNIEKLLEGTELTLKMFNDAVNKFGVEVLDPIDQPFNPEFHQAMSMQESHIKPANTVLAVMQKGYTLNGRLVRPAMVVVSKASPQSGSSDDKSGSEKVGTNIDEQA
ncbi:MAG: nucleotide exchange factor GrpE [Gammaproteobacteria bacterium]|jgi:molecular chaperone GrpE